MKVTKRHEELVKLDRELNKFGSAVIRVGILSDNETNDEGITILEYAIHNEYGTDRIPARPFFRTATQTAEAQKKIKAKIGSVSKKIVDTKGSYTAIQATNAIGEYVRGLVVESISNGNWIPNTEETLRRKGTHKRPLIDQGDLIRSIDFEVTYG